VRIGYCRISTLDQDPQLQTDALERAECEKIFTDRGSGADPNRPALAEALRFAREGDVLIVWKFDRMARSTRHMIEIGEDLERRRVHLRSLTEPFDTTTPWGQAIYQILAVLGQLERSIALERTMAGLAAARARGKVGGRPRLLSPDQEKAVLALLAAGTHTNRQIGDLFGCSARTVRLVRERHRATRSPSTPDGNGNGSTTP
jgi:DNA invertase Pin-like site-specific DNA recombinase